MAVTGKILLKEKRNTIIWKATGSLNVFIRGQRFNNVSTKKSSLLLLYFYPIYNNKRLLIKKRLI